MCYLYHLLFICIHMYSCVFICIHVWYYVHCNQLFSTFFCTYVHNYLLFISVDTTVVGYCLENFQGILFILILLPLISTILYSLLTKYVIDNGMDCLAEGNDINFKYADTFCKQCNDEGMTLKMT